MNKLIAFDIDGVVSDTYTSEIKNRTYDPELYLNVIKPFKDALDNIPKVYQLIGTPIVFLTARPHNLIDATYQWLDRYFPTIQYKIFFEDSLFKFAFLAKHGFRYMVEDKIKVVEKIEPPTKVFLIDREYNRGMKFARGNVVRVSNIKNIYEILKKELQKE